MAAAYDGPASCIAAGIAEPTPAADDQPLKCCSMAFIMSSGEICPSKARCMLVGQTRPMKSGVFGESGSEAAIGSDAMLASTKRFGCRVQFAAADVAIGSWPVNLFSTMLFSAVDRNAHHRKAASLALLEEKTALDSSPKYVQPLPSGARGTGTADTLSPSTPTISFAEPTWWIVMAVRPALNASTICRKLSVGAEAGTTLSLVARS